MERQATVNRTAAMKVIFLDVDGVLNTLDTVFVLGFDDKLVRILQLTVMATKAKLVISSSWREVQSDYDLLCSKLAEFELLTEVVGCTPTFKREVPRNKEIRSWLNQNEVERFAIVDDDPEAMLKESPDSFFKTSLQYGLTPVIANKVVHYLNG